MWMTKILALTCLFSLGRGDDPNRQCNNNERFTECASSTCFEETCADLRDPGLTLKKCTKDCLQGCQCKPGFYRNYDGTCVNEISCMMCGYGETWVDCGRGGCKEDEYDLTCDIVVNDDGDSGILPIMMSGCKCQKDYYRSKDGLCVSKEACESCGINEVWETCGSSSCWEFTCDDSLVPKIDRWPRACTLDCRQGCKCHQGFFRDEQSVDCVIAEECSQTT